MTKDGIKKYDAQGVDNRRREETVLFLREEIETLSRSRVVPVVSSHS